MNRSRLIIMFSIAALLAPVLPAMADHERGGVTLYDAGNFRGQSESFSQDDPDLSNNRIGNDHVSSVRVARGCRARLYDDRDYRGRFAELSGDEPDMRRTRLGNDRASSLKIRCAWDVDWNDGNDDSDSGHYGDSDSGHDHGDSDSDSGHDHGDSDSANVRNAAILYTNESFRGPSETFRHGADVADLRRVQFGDDRASSVRVADGCRLRLYAEPEYRGDFVEISSDLDSLARTRVGNQRASSLKVRCGPPFAWGADLGQGRGGQDRGWDGNDRGGLGVTIYSETGFRGSSDTFGHGHDIANLTATRVGNDRLSSVRVDRGCRVRLFAAGEFSGDWLELRSDVENLDFTALRNRTVSSLKVRCDGAGWDGGWGDADSDRRDDRGDRGDRRDDYGVTLYAGGDFRGVSETFDRDVPSLAGSRIGNDAASSVRVPRGCHARLYRHADYRGEYAELRFDERDLSVTPVGNDSVSSLRVRCDSRGGSRGDRGSVTLYRGGDYRDVSETFYDDVPSLAGTRVGNDTASSITIAPGCTVWLYRAGNYGGEYAELRFDEPDLGRTPVGNDTVSSLRLRCDR